MQDPHSSDNPSTSGLGEDLDSPKIPLRDSISIRNLLSNDGVTFEVNFDEVLPEEPIERAYAPSEVFEHTNAACINFMDDFSYGDGDCEPFEVISKQMTNVTDDGKIKKQILRKGLENSKCPDSVQYTIHYNAYTEYNDEPFDSSYIRKRTFRFCPGNGETLPGLEIAVQSMILNEKSRFLVSSDLAYGDLGCLERIPPKATILYEIELLNWINVKSEISDGNLTPEQQRDFYEVYKYCLATCSKGNELYSKSMYKQAIREYNHAVINLENAVLRDITDQEKQQKLLLRLLSNLAVTFTKIQEPKRTCKTCNRIYQMCKGTSLRPTAKVYFNHARSLMQLDDYTWAERQLKQAQRLEPQNQEIASEFRRLDAKKKESYDREVKIAKTIFQHNQIVRDLNQENEDELIDDFCEVIKSLCIELKSSEENNRFKVGANLTQKEKSFVNEEADKHDLVFIADKGNDGMCYIARKASSS